MKKNIKILIGIIIGIVISVTCTVVAETIIESKEVSYDNAKSGGSYNEVQDSIDELYARAGYTAEKYKEDILHGADPVLGEGMIPVYLAENGDVYYANEHTSWYSYEYKRWANAVILVDDAYNKYSVGQKISEEDIESYFVWIPRYAYKLWNLANTDGVETITFSNTSFDTSPLKIINSARIIEIQFGNVEYLNKQGYKKQTRDVNTGLVSDPAGIKIGDYLIHPGFTLGEKELNGFWIGKFETGYNQSGNGSAAITGTDKWSNAAAQVNVDDSKKIIVKPNVFSWRGNNVYNFFMSGYNYNRNLNSHMLKNTEWGAVAYLSHSIYGLGTKANVNNNSDCLTGYSRNADKIIGEYGTYTNGYNDTYDTTTGYLASTTGNITGVYDMAGGSQEYVASRLVVNNEKISSDVSFFTLDELKKYIKAGYIDTYQTANSMSYSKRILGDATGEMGPFYLYYDNKGGIRPHSSWYNEAVIYMQSESFPWLYRGDYHGSIEASIYTSLPYSGANTWIISSRLSLTGKADN